MLKWNNVSQDKILHDGMDYCVARHNIQLWFIASLELIPSLRFLDSDWLIVRLDYVAVCAMLPMRHAATLGGCFHCVTLDLDRDDD